MTSIKTAAAIAVVAVIVIAVGAYALLNNGGGGNGSDSPVDAIDTKVEVGDEYTLLVSTDGGTLGAETSTNYKVTGVYGDDLTVDVTTNNSTQSNNMTKDEFLDNVSVTESSLVGEVIRTEQLNTAMGTVSCTVYRNALTANDASIEILEWIGGSNVIYKTQMTTTIAGVTDIKTTTLTGTNMITDVQPGESIVPDVPSAGDGLRTELEAGDYIEFTKHDDDDIERERFTVISVNGDMVTYRESGDDDVERTSVNNFLSLVRYSGDSAPIGQETIQTKFGNILCNIYEVNYFGGALDFDWEDRVIVWAAVDDNIIYKIESQDDYWDDDDRWDDWYDDIEAYYLTDTSLFDMAPSEDSGTTPVPTPNDNRFGIELRVGDSYTIRDDDRETVTYEIVQIQGSRLIVKETERGGFGYDDVEFDDESANEFLSRIVINSDQLQRMYSDTGETATIGGVICQVYRELYDDDRETISVQNIGGSNYIIWEKLEEWDDRDTLIEYNIASL